MPKLKNTNIQPSAIAASSHNPNPEQVYAAACAYVDAGLSLMPIRPDGSKSPATELLPRLWSPAKEGLASTWKVFQARQPTVDELNSWYLDTDYVENGMAVVAGKVSGNLEILDLDSFDVVEPWRKAVEAQQPDLLKRLVCVVTPRPGLHIYYRCSTIGGCEKLARAPETDPASGEIRPKAIAETKGEGGYCLCPPSPAECHPQKTCYRFESDKDLTLIPSISPEERAILLNAAKSLNTWEERAKTFTPQRRLLSRRDNGNRPGDQFNARAEWAEILEPHGWKRETKNADGSETWCRPGKGFGISATVNFRGLDLLHVFSTNADPFEEKTAYTKFHAYCLLAHDGDFSAAAKQLAEEGYGDSGLVLPHMRSRSSGQENPYAGFTSRSRSP